jgi:hypothetical protein
MLKSSLKLLFSSSNHSTALHPQTQSSNSDLNQSPPVSVSS